MFCKNCGKELANDAKFCPTCGQPTDFQSETVAQPTETPVSNATVVETPATEAPVTETPVVETPITEAPVTETPISQPVYQAAPAVEDPFAPMQSTTPVTTMPPKKPANKKLIAGIIAVALVLCIAVVGVFAHSKIANVVKKQFSSPKSYYQYVEKKNADESKDTFTNYYKTLYDTISKRDEAREATYTIELGDSLKTMLSMTGMDFSSLNSIKLKTNAQLDKNVTKAKMVASFNDKDAATINMYYDLENKEYYLQIPELSKSYLDLSASLKKAAESTDEQKKLYDMMSAPAKFMPTPKQVSTLYDTYSDIVINNLKNVTKKSTTLTVDGVAQKCTKLTVTAKGSDAYKIANEVLTTLKSDKTVKEIITNVDKDSYEDFTSSMSDAIEELEGKKDTMNDSKTEFAMDVYVNEDGTIIGRDITATNDDDSTIKLRSHMPQKGSKFGYLFDVSVDDTTMVTITGDGTRKGDKLNGNFKLGVDSAHNPLPNYITDTDDIVDIELTDFDLDALKDGYTNGSITIKSNSVAALSGYSIKLDMKGSKSKSSCILSIEAAGESLAKITMDSGKGSAPDVNKPSDSDTKYDVSDSTQMQSYTSEIDIQSFLSDLQTKTGLDLSSLMSSLGSSSY